MNRPGPLLGAELTLDVGPVAHGGHCVARHEGRVVFVRHALPGEQVRATVTEDAGGSFCRADAVEVLQPAPGRVPAPCPQAGPGRCGGCDWQHADAATQHELKRAVILEQFQRLAGLDVTDQLPAVTALPGGLLGWRTRIGYAVDPDGRPGLRLHRSHEVLPMSGCPLGTAEVGDAVALARTWPGYTGIEVARGDTGTAVLGHRPGPGRPIRGRRPPDRIERVDGPDRLTHRVADREFTLDPAGFWQVHPDAITTFIAALLDATRPVAGESVLELYAGAGALTAALAGAVGPSGRVLALEGSSAAVADAQANLADLTQVEVRRARIEAASLAALGSGTDDGSDASDGRPDLIVLDPPRAGAGPQTMAALLALGPRAVGYVACDPAALARDVRVALDAGWLLADLRAFDAFPMTHHVECVALLVAPTRPRATRVPSAEVVV